jgi:hypothetical protein
MENINTSNPQVGLERIKSKKYSLKKSISHINCRPKTTKEFFDESFSGDIIQTNLERMINNLGGIKKKLLLLQDIEMANQIDWMIDTLLKNQLNDVIVRIEGDQFTNALEIERMLELLAEYSSEFNVKRNIEQLQSTFLMKKNTMKVDNGITDDFQQNLLDKILTRKFDIFNLSQEVGRENVLKIVSGNLFNYFSLMDKIEKDKFFNFIEEIRMGYKKNNYYHNVSKL